MQTPQIPAMAGMTPLGVKPKDPRLVHEFEYKGRKVSITSAGHQSVQNISIDGKPAGYVTFPALSIDVARGIIDQREFIEDRQMEMEAFTR